MDEFGANQSDLLTAKSPDFGETPYRMNTALPFAPLAGLLLLTFILPTYRPLEEFPFTAIGVALFLLATFLMSYIKKRIKRGANVKSFFPITTWLAFGPAVLALIVLVNAHWIASQSSSIMKLLLASWLAMARLLHIMWSLHRGGRIERVRRCMFDIRFSPNSKWVTR